MSFIQKRIRGMMGRILSSMEQTLEHPLGDIKPEDLFELNGDQVLLIRNAILDACNDTIRSLPSHGSSNDLVIPQNGIKSLTHASLDVLESDNSESAPMISMWGPIEFIHMLRDQIGRGIVYTKNGKCYYVCIGTSSNAEFVIPFLDKVRLTGINVACGTYKSWRDEVIGLYIGDIEDDD